MNQQPQEQPLYKSNSLGIWIHVYANRVEFKSGVSRQSIPINQIAGVRLGRPLLMQITLETTGGQKYAIATNHKQQVQRAIYDAQARFANPGMSYIAPPAPLPSVADEIAKLHGLRQQGIISDADFEAQKRRLLGS